MTIQVNIGEAKTRLSELVAACERGETVVLARAGTPVVRMVPAAEAGDARDARAARRMAQVGFAGRGKDEAEPVEPVAAMTPAEIEERFERKFGRPA